MNSEVIIKAKWFLPNEAGNEIPGEVKFDPRKGIELTLYGAFKGISDEVQFINGVSDSGKEITIFKSVKTYWQFPSKKGFSVTRYFGTILLVGIHATKASDLKFGRIEASISLLDNWLDIESFSVSRSKDRKDIRVHYTLPDEIEVQLSNGKALTIRHTYDHGNANQRQSFHINQSSFFSLKYQSKRRLESIVLDIGIFKNLVTLLSDHPSVHYWLKAYRSRAKKEKPVQVYYKTLNPNIEKQEIENHRMLLPYKDIKGEIKGIIKNWYESYDILKVVYDQIFSIRYSPMMFESDKFLGLCRAMEAFQREVMGKGKKKGTSFNDRIIELLQKYGKGFLRRAKIGNTETFAKRIVKLRNDATHANSIDDIGNSRAIEEVKYSSKLDFLMTAIILTHIGVHPELVKKNIVKKQLAFG